MKELILLKKLEELDLYAHKATLQFPKHEKHVLCAHMRETLAQIIKLVVRCSKKYYKKTTLQDIDVELEYYRSLVRKAFVLRYINTKKYEIWSRHTDEIGRIIGGWIKNVKG